MSVAFAASVLVNLAVDVQLGASTKLSGGDMVNGIVKNAAMSLKFGSTELKKSILQEVMALNMNVVILCGIVLNAAAIMKITGKLNGVIPVSLN